MSSLKSDFSADRKYSEFFLLRGEKHQVYRLEVPKEVFWAYQTDGAMNDLLIKTYEQVGSMEVAIDIMIKNQSRFEELKDELKSTRITEEEAIGQIKNFIKFQNYE